MIGLWIDGLTDEQRDRIVSAQGWITGRVGRPSEGTHCLIGHAHHDVILQGDTAWKMWVRIRPILGDVGTQFDDLCRRFGKDRVVRAIKLRASAATSADAAPLPTTAEPTPAGPQKAEALR